MLGSMIQMLLTKEVFFQNVVLLKSQRWAVLQLSGIIKIPTLHDRIQI